MAVDEIFFASRDVILTS